MKWRGLLWGAWLLCDRLGVEADSDRLELVIVALASFVLSKILRYMVL